MSYVLLRTFALFHCVSVLRRIMVVDSGADTLLTVQEGYVYLLFISTHQVCLS